MDGGHTSNSVGKPDLRVLFLMDGLQESGGTRIVVDLVQRLRQAGVAADLFAMFQETSAAFAAPADFPVIYPSKTATRRREALFATVRWLTKHARDYDVLVSGSEIGTSLIVGQTVARAFRKPFVTLILAPVEGQMKRWMPRPLRPLNRRAIRLSDIAVCLSAGMAEDVIAYGMPKDRARVIEYGVDPDQARELAKQAPDVELPKPYALGVGRLTEQKGFDILIEAHARALKLGPAHSLVLIGEGFEEEVAPLKALAARLGVSNSVHFLGFRENPQPFLARADLFVLSSRREGLVRVLFEALAHATPVIATDCHTGPRYVLKDETFGRLVPVEDVEALATAMAEHFSNPQVLRDRARGGPERANDFHPARMVEKVLGIVHELAKVPQHQ